MNDTLLSLVYERLERGGAVDEPWSALVMAACEGRVAVESVLGSGEVEKTIPKPASTPSEPPGVFLGPISVAGFRGVGQRATLDLAPGPGLTLVVGRNGSGKSSFAEGLELLLTGQNKRWSGRTKAWSDDWRNLHAGDPCEIQALLSVEGAGSTAVRRSWARDAEMDDAETVVQPHGQPRTTLDALGWRTALETHRPFLSYNELGSMLDEGPSKLYDALARVLGLDDLVEADAALSTARRDRQKATKQVKALSGQLQTRLQTLTETTDDSRVVRCLELLGARRQDLDALERLTAGADDGQSGDDLGLLKQCAALRPPATETVEGVASRLVEATALRGGFTGTEGERAGELADLLDVALAFYEKHTADNCPVCGRESALGESWREATTAEVDRLRVLAQQCRHADQQLVYRVQREGSSGLIDVTVPARRFRTLGLSMDIGRIAAIRDGSPAQAAGLKVGDKLVTVNGEDIGKTTNPLELPNLLAALHGQDVKLEVLREQPTGKPETVALSVVPLDLPGWLDQPEHHKAPLSVPALGMAFNCSVNILVVAPGSPADVAGIKPGEEISRVAITRRQLTPEAEATELELKFEDPKANWAHAVWQMQWADDSPVVLEVVGEDGKERSVRVTPLRNPKRNWFLPIRGTQHLPLIQTRQAEGIIVALQMGMGQTETTLMRIWLTLRSLFTGDISVTELTGPIGIARVAYSFAEQGLSRLLQFLAFLSFNLAVINFLPIPVLDGGHMVFLTWEAVTRKRPSERVLIAATYCGLAFVLVLMVTVIFVDLERIPAIRQVVESVFG